VPFQESNTGEENRLEAGETGWRQALHHQLQLFVLLATIIIRGEEKKRQQR
jgi:hypothetical protein